MKLMLLVCLAIAGTAHAQVYKCAGTDGKTVYSQAPCPDAGRQMRAGELSGNAAGRVKAAPAQPLAGGGNLPAGAGANIPGVTVGQATNCPSEQEIRSMETEASAKFAKGRDTELLKLQAAAARDCRAGRGPYDPSAIQRQLEAKRKAEDPYFCHGAPNSGTMFCQK